MRFPPVRPGDPEPIWDGQTFHVGEQKTKILEYGCTDEGWRDDLTIFQEENAGTDHFMDLASRTLALRQVNKFLRISKPIVLEVGCSSGFMLKRLKDNNIDGITTGADIVKEPLEKLATLMPNVPLLRFDLTRCPMADNSVDAVVALNVLEHIKDDATAIKHLHRILKPGGIAVLEVPAGPELYGDYDRLLMHYRRYSMKQFRNLLERAGFSIESASHLGCFIYPGFWLVKQLTKLKSSTNQINTRAVESNITQTRTNHFLKLITDLELYLGKWLRYPFGIRCVITCSKQQSYD